MSKRLKLANGTIWPDPNDQTEWQLRYAPNRGAELMAAGTCAAYRDLIVMPARKRNQTIAMIRKAIQERAMSDTRANLSNAELDALIESMVDRIEQLQAENERLSGALTEIKQLKSHRHPCCPTNLPKGIANEALQESRYE